MTASSLVKSIATIYLKTVKWIYLGVMLIKESV